LIYDNCYRDQEDRSDYNICFCAQASSLKRINTYFYKLSTFPTTIPFSDVIALDETVIEGRLIKHTASTTSEAKEVGLIKSDYIRRISDSELTEFSDLLEQYDRNFILVGDTIDPQVRLFEGIADIIHHQDWNRTAVSVVHGVYEKPDRKYCWTYSVPELSISCYGINDAEEIKKVHDAFNMTGDQDVSVTWAG